MDDSMLILLVLLPASISDLTHYKISNAVIINGLILSLFFRCCTNGIREIVPWCLGILIPFLIGFIFYLFRAFGASDIKLLSVVGSFYGIQTCMLVIICALFAGAVFSLLLMHKRHELPKRLQCMYSHMFQVIICKKIEPYDREQEKKEGSVLPFAICISSGVFFVRLFGFS